jgi:hypothetical protein
MAQFLLCVGEELKYRYCKFNMVVNLDLPVQKIPETPENLEQIRGF